MKDNNVVIEWSSSKRVCIRTDILRDTQLSWEAKGLYAYLFSCVSPGFDVEDFVLSVTPQEWAGERSLNQKKNRIRKLMLEFKAGGYCKFEDEKLVLLDHKQGAA